MSRILHTAYAVGLVACGVLSIWFSTQVYDGFGTPPVLVLFAAILIFVLIFAQLAIENFVALLRGKRLPWLKHLGVAGVAAIFVFGVMFVAGIRLEGRLHDETERRGDRLAVLVERHRAETGRCPDSGTSPFNEIQPAFFRTRFVIERGAVLGSAP